MQALLMKSLIKHTGWSSRSPRCSLACTGQQAGRDKLKSELQRQILAWLSLLFVASAPAKDLTYSNPVLAGDYPDPSVIRVGGEYWATATTSEWAPLFPLLRSRDLMNWEHVSNVFEKRPDWSAGNYWAPEISAHRGRYFIYYVGRKKNGPLSIAVATAPHPTGPWIDHGPFISQEAGSIDPVHVVDEKGDRYLVWKEDGNSRKLPTPLWIAPLSEDGTKLSGEMKEILRNDAPWEKHLIEGPFVIGRSGWFYLFYSADACCGSRCDYKTGVARARSLLGPWEKNPANPILAGNETWRCPGHGSIVTDERGRDYFLYHAYHAKTFTYVGRQGLLDEVKWGADHWPSINEGRGPSTNALAPAESRRELTSGASLHTFVDEFTASKLRPEWQWPQQNEPVTSVSPLNGGQLLLSPNPHYANDMIGGVLAVRTTTGSYTAATLLEARELTPGAKAGLSAFGDMANALGIVLDGDKVRIWRRQRNKTEFMATNAAPSIARIHFRMRVSDGHHFRFAFSDDGRNWKDIGRDIDLEGDYLPPWDRGLRVALTAGGIENSAAKFDWLRIVPATK
jgi:beta-xylosidase